IEEWLNEFDRCPWGLIQSEPSALYQLFGYFDDPAAARAAWPHLRAVFPSHPVRPRETTLDDRDWREAYKAHLRPWSAHDLHWVPVWLEREYPLPPGHVRLLFDAGLAFGTGDHPTTRLMALRLLDFRAARGPENFSSSSVIDAGCGSGILALSAALLGCRRVFAFDRDPEAVRVSRDNLAANRLPSAAVEFAHAALEDGLRGRTADLLLANIQADVLAIHADDLAAAVAPGGVLALSGILASEVDDVRAGFEPVLDRLWSLEAPDDLADFGDSRVLGDWCDLVFQRADS
ncbi:MAG: 50S ribosomal protein L11 methyltransferase, partial [Opitutales bacterium]